MHSEEIRAELARIVASPMFRQSARLSRFLSFVVEASLDGRANEVKEYVIAIDVCGRKESFDPRLDSVVRVEAGRLRSKLREYYEGPGQDDPVRIDVPKGAYVPVFQAREEARPVPAGRRPLFWVAAAAFAGAAALLAVSPAIRPTRAGSREAPPPSGNPAAQDALVKGRHNSLQYLNSGSPEYYTQAEQLLSRALALAPGDAEALVEMGLLYGRRYQATGEAAWMRKAAAHFRQALAIQPCHATAHAVLSSIVREEGDFDQAIEHGRKAVACDAASAQGHNALGLTYLYMGFYESAEFEFRSAAECDRLFLSPYLNRIETMLYEKRPAEAVAAGREAAQVEPRSGLALFKLGDALLANGELDAARQRWEEAAAADPRQLADLREIALALLEFDRGDPAPARAALARYRGNSRFRSVLWSSEYLDLCLRAGEPAAAMDCLDASPHYREYRALVTDPLLARLKGEPRFARMIEQRRARWTRDLERYAPSLPAPPPKL